MAPKEATTHRLRTIKFEERDTKELETVIPLTLSLSKGKICSGGGKQVGRCGLQKDEQEKNTEASFWTDEMLML